MTFGLDKRTTLWEAVAAVQIAQARGCDQFLAYGAVEELFKCAGLEILAEGAYTPFNFSDAYRAIDTQAAPYCSVLAATNDMIGLQLSAPQFPQVQPLPNESIVVCPFPPKSELGLPESVWRVIVHYLRGYQRDVYLLGAAGQWQDYCSYSEDDILSERPVAEKLSILAGCKLVVGVPNEWTWAATAWSKHMVYFYPDAQPERRWFHFADSNFGRALYKADQLQTTVILQQLKTLIKMI